MSNFKSRKISSRPPRKPLSEKAKHNIITALGIILLIVVIYYAGMQALGALSSMRVFQFISGIFSKDLVMDERSHTNILLVGVGGEGHEGQDLTDTLIVGSIDHKNKTAAIISIPRDLYVESSLGGSRINRLYEQGKLKWNSRLALDFLKTTVSDILNVPIHYYAKMDFKAFEEIIDELGGIDVYVDYTIDDKEYPQDGTYGFEPFYLEKGMQHLDGATALKYVRSRKSSSDFDRSARQHKTLVALKNKAQEKNMFSRERVLKNIYYSLNDHVETDMSMREMLSLADFGIAWNTDNLRTATLNDEPNYRGGFLYTPLRELYGGAYVLLPAGESFEHIRNFTELVLYGPQNLENLPVAILNGTGEPGLAGNVAAILKRFGINVVKVANAKTDDIADSAWYVHTLAATAAPAASTAPANEEISPEASSAEEKTETELLADFLQKLIPGTISAEIPAQYAANSNLAEAKLILEIGKSSLPIIEKLDVFRNIVLLVPPKGNGE